MTKSEEVYRRVEEMVGTGSTKAQAFAQLAEEYEQPANSLRGLYYTWSKSIGAGQTPRPKSRRETTPEAALEDARLVLQRAIASVDEEVDAAEERAQEAKAEFDALKGSAKARKEAIQGRLDALA